MKFRRLNFSEVINLDIQKMFFSLDGRLNRKPYFFGNLALALISGLSAIVLFELV